ncbi:MAG: DUF438 domain-containing protein [Spirochaetae bacterium HGW-Spirochaetae-3]|jgi:hypothetical protein|nr:MAG: DUF438 domain-containing protein [Spirochaetae bacterium HGW-Spirochaetae-3]
MTRGLHFSHEGTRLEVSLPEEARMSEYLTKNPDKAERARRLKAIIDKLAAGSSPSKVKKEFHDLIKDADAAEVAELEQSLIEGGLPVEEVQRLCEVHADVFKAGLERGEKAERMPGHPVHTYMAENAEARRRVRTLRIACVAGGLESIADAVAGLKPIIVHFTRKENQLFPYLERTGFTGPSKVMWGKHDEIRALFKELAEVIAREDVRAARRKGRDLGKRVRMMAFMEEKILFPNALKRLSDADWAAVRVGEDAIGFAWIEPGAAWDPALVGSQRAGASGGAYANLAAAIEGAKAGVVPTALGPGSSIPLSVGALPLDVLDRVLKSLPIDVSFVDADDKVMYYSDSPHRVFPRSPGIIGRSVENCHPPKSVAVVTSILEAFRKKEKDKAEFWIEMNGRFIVISYKPIYDDDGVYLGTLEMSWDATDTRALQGQRRLLDW